MIVIIYDNISVTHVENLTIKDSWYDKESIFMYITNITYHTSKGAALLGLSNAVLLSLFWH